MTNLDILKYKQDYFGFVYLWYDKFKDKICIGSHFGSLQDGYTTSTGHCKFAIKKRPKDFERIILYFHKENNRKTLLKEEQKFLNCIPTELFGEFTYNLKKYAEGGNAVNYRPSEETKRKISFKKVKKEIIK